MAIITVDDQSEYLKRIRGQMTPGDLMDKRIRETGITQYDMRHQIPHDSEYMSASGPQYSDFDSLEENYLDFADTVERSRDRIANTSGEDNHGKLMYNWLSKKPAVRGSYYDAKASAKTGQLTDQDVSELSAILHAGCDKIDYKKGFLGTSAEKRKKRCHDFVDQKVNSKLTKIRNKNQSLDELFGSNIVNEMDFGLSDEQAMLDAEGAGANIAGLQSNILPWLMGATVIAVIGYFVIKRKTT